MRISPSLLIVSIVSGLFSTPDSSAVIDEIQIVGNEITKEYVIRREIQHPLGVSFDSTIAAEDRNRIDNLEIFSQVSFERIPNRDGTETIVFHVEEAWRFFPAPVIVFEEETGWAYGGAMIVKNFRGRDEILEMVAAGGGTEFGAFRFQNPWITGDHVSLEAHLYFTTYGHPFLGFRYRELDGEVTLGRYFGYNWKLWLTGSVEQRWADYDNPARTDIKHQYFQTKIRLLYDTRDLYINPSKGMMVYNEWRPDVGLDGESPHNVYWDSQVSFYHTIIPGARKWVAGGSLFFHTYWGESIPYKVVMAGGARSVRGWSVLDSARYEQEPYRAGLNEYFASFELRQTLIPKRLLAPRTEFGLLLLEFIDVGAAGDEFWSTLKGEPLIGAGIGVRMFVPGAFLFRIDYGAGYHNGEWRPGVWHFDMGHKF